MKHLRAFAASKSRSSASDRQPRLVLRNYARPRGIRSVAGVGRRGLRRELTTNHHPAGKTTKVTLIGDASNGPLLRRPSRRWVQFDCLALQGRSPLRSGTAPILTGTLEGAPAEPIAWTFTRKGGRDLLLHVAWQHRRL